jgi:hypothetical protein
MNIDDLRETLFATLQAVKDGSMDTDKARQVNEVAKTIIETARVEVEYLRVTGGGESEFLASTVGADNLPQGIVGITRHRIAG